MIIRDISNTSVEDLAQIAADILDKRGELTVKCDRARSEVILPKYENSTFVITPALKERLFSQVTPKYTKGDYGVFKDEQGNLCYVSKEVIQICSRILHKRCPDHKLMVSKDYAIVDRETGTELMPADTAKEYGLEIAPEKDQVYTLTCEISAFIYTLERKS